MMMFILKMLAILMAIATSLILEGFLAGELSAAYAMLLLPIGVFITGKMFKLSVRKPRRRVKVAICRGKNAECRESVPSLRMINAESVKKSSSVA